MADPKHSHGRFVLCPPSCPRAGMSDGPCAVCGDASDPKALVATGGGNDYPVCGKAHADVLWLALDAAQAAEETRGLPAPPWPVAYPPDWIQLEGLDGCKGTVEDLAAWAAVSAHAAAIAAVRGE